MPDWVYLDKNEDGITMNKYFVDHPEMILGKMEMKTTQYGRLDSVYSPIPEQNLEDELQYAISNIHASIPDYEIQSDDNLENDEIKTIPADPSVKNFSYTIVDGELYFRENSIMTFQDVTLTNKNRIIQMIAILIFGLIVLLVKISAFDLNFPSLSNFSSEHNKK